MGTVEDFNGGRSLTTSKTASTELSARRTGMSFQRTRLSADRTLMSVIRTSLSLIGFGFTIFKFFSSLRDSHFIASESQSPRQLGLALVVLGMTMLVIGIWYHVRFMLALRRTREEMTADRLIHGQSEFPLSLTLIVAVILFLIGLAATANMVFALAAA
jgi:putative membrane protein